MLQSIILLCERVFGAAAHPFSVPAINYLTTLHFAKSRITFFSGENGSCKSTLLEAMAGQFASAATAISRVAPKI